MTNTFRTASHVFPFLRQGSNLTKFQTRGGWPEATARPSQKKLGCISVFRQNVHGVPRYRCRRFHFCHFTDSVQKINLAVTSWNRGECQGGSRIFRVRLVIFRSIVAPRAFQVGTAQHQPRVPKNHVCHKAKCLLSQFPFQLPASAECCRQIPSTPLGARLKANVALFH